MIQTRETHFPIRFTNTIPFKDNTITKNKRELKTLNLSSNHLNKTNNHHHNHRRNNKSDLIDFRLLDRSVMAIEPIRKTTSDAASAAASATASSLILTSGASGRINALFSFRALKTVVMLISTLLLLLLFPFRGRKRANSFVSSSSSAIEDKDGNNDEKKVGGGGVRVPAKIVLPPWRSAAVKAVAADHEATARRAIAIRRVVQDCDGENDGHEKSVREFELFGSARGDTMFAQSWSPPASIEIRGVVVLLHGLNEHRYNNFARQLNAYGYKVYAMDWIGHGGSDGLHAYVPNLDDAVTDLISYFEKVLAENPGLPCFCFGHSTGAAIILKAVLDPKVETRVAGVVLTSPAVGVQPAHPVFVLIAPILSFLLPKYQFSPANKKGMAVSRDPEALVAKYSDPLVFTGSIRVRTGYEILRITSYLQQNLKRLRVPFLVLHGTADSVTDPEASQRLYEEASSTDKSIKLYDGFLHDLLFEPERDEITQDIIDWLNSRVNNNA